MGKIPAKYGFSAEFGGKFGDFCQENGEKIGISPENTRKCGNLRKIRILRRFWEELWIYTENFGITGNF